VLSAEKNLTVVCLYSSSISHNSIQSANKIVHETLGIRQAAIGLALYK
jgi:hypothetical protein